MAKLKRAKKLSSEEFRKTYRDNEKLGFYYSLPFSSIHDPRELIGFAVHYNDFTSLMVNTRGTAYAFYADSANRLLKLYEYSLLANSPDGGILWEVEKKDIPSHHIKNLEEIPSTLKSEKIIKNAKTVLE